MSRIIQATTPDLVFEIKGRDLTGCTVNIYFRQGNNCIIASTTEGRVSVAADSKGSTLYVRLTQEETLALDKGATQVQAHWIDANGNADATYPPVTISNGRILKAQTITYQGGD